MSITAWIQLVYSLDEAANMTSSEYDEYLIAKKDAMGEFGRFAGFNECTSKVLIKCFLSYR